MKQTAVEWLEKEIENISIQVFDGYLTFVEFMEQREKLFNQAKQMEKEQIKNAFSNGYLCHSKTSEQYYNKTFNK